MNEDGKVRGLPVFTCPEPEFNGCQLTKRACAMRHVARQRVGKGEGTITVRPYLKTCAVCPVGAQHAKELAVEMLKREDVPRAAPQTWPQHKRRRGSFNSD